MTEKSIQETYAPNLKCFGCGPANEQGLHIRSFPAGDEVIADWQPESYQEAFPRMSVRSAALAVESLRASHYTTVPSNTPASPHAH